MELPTITKSHCEELMQLLAKDKDKRIAHLEQQVERLQQAMQNQPGYVSYGEQRYREGMERAAEIVDDLYSEDMYEGLISGFDAAQAIRAKIGDKDETTHGPTTRR